MTSLVQSKTTFLFDSLIGPVFKTMPTITQTETHTSTLLPQNHRGQPKPI